MKIAIQVADLDQARIDGTRVYILNLLKHFGKLDAKSEFLLFHKKDFNPELAPPEFPNYKICQKPFPFLWSQIGFAWEIWKKKPDVLWMPMAALPIIRRKKTKSVITIHDLAFKYFPEYFTKKHLPKLELFTCSRPTTRPSSRSWWRAAFAMPANSRMGMEAASRA